MGIDHRESWDSLTSALSSLDVSFSQDSCYGSDEYSITSNPAGPLQSSVSSVSTCLATREPDLHKFLKPILKNSTSYVELDAHSESGYGSDEIDSDYDELSDQKEDDEEDDDDGNSSDFSVWDETSGDVPETQEDHTESFDDSFITFETVGVHFDTDVHYIDTPELSEDDEASGSQMTVHEMMLAHKPGSPNVVNYLNGVDTSENEDGHQEFVRHVANPPEEFSRDAVDLDRRLFVAYMNGIHGIADSKYKTYLHAQVDNIRVGLESDSFDSDDSACMYLDLISNHVNGVFRNLLADDEVNELVALYEEEQTTTLTPTPHQTLLDKIEHLLQDRLANGRVEVCPDELSFFAGGVVHAIGGWQ
ncbi:hypothetical protein N7474_006599 [Penicillium riverlandense]|uniref:uncharacterized protein n=1 Tax=Penicillium riverlandense TaxID=1903569 RepID=UPI0025483703|nr:uncharacterized protein N7474_006599 [Penicillium riverlandense]KAJ5814822.1 hypothetical protein N7474_006599 [Penicillium riverlandense]